METNAVNLQEIVTHKNYLYHTAGRVWVIPEVKMSKNPDGSIGISFEEIERIQRAVANEICGSSRPLSGAELEFLCDATHTKHGDVAEKFGVSKGNVSHWINSKSALSFERSIILKRWFWRKLFGDQVGSTVWEIPKVLAFVDENLFFETLRNLAIENGLTFEVKQAS